VSKGIDLSSAQGNPVLADSASLIDPCTDPATGFHRRLEEVFRLD